MATADRDAPGPRASRSARSGFEPWPWALAALLLAMIGCSLSLWAIASSHPDGLVGDAWETGLRYNGDLAARREARAQGVSMRADVTPTAAGALVSVVLAGASEDAVEAVTVDRIRPAESGYDETYGLAPAPPETHPEARERRDVWSGEVPLPRDGRWQLRVRTQLAGARLEQTIGLWHDAAGGTR